MSSSDNFPDVGDVPGVAISRPIGELPACTQVYATQGLRSQRGVSGAERAVISIVDEDSNGLGR
jgi:hypothetical protein